MSETFYRKYRPQTFADVVDQKHIVTTLTNALRLGRVGHAYLFTGPRGTGKTTLARILAKAINCLDRQKKNSEPCGKCGHCILMAEGRSMDVIEIDAASNTGVDNIRELRETVTLPPNLGSHKIYIIDEVHMLSQGAFNALLKTLEEPPAHVVFILATTALHKVPDTIISRTQRFDLSRFPVKSIADKLKKIAKAEKIKVEDEALEMIALSAEGGMRDAESLFMQVASLADGPISADLATEVLGTTKKENIFALLNLIASGSLKECLFFVRGLTLDGKDLHIFSGGLLTTLRDLLYASVQRDQNDLILEGYTKENLHKLLDFAKRFSPEEVIRMLEYVQVAVRDTKNAFIRELPLEIALVKILADKKQVDPGNGPTTPPQKNESRQSTERLDSESTQGSAPHPPEQAVTENPTPSTAKIVLKEVPVAPAAENEASETSIDAATVQNKWPNILAEVKRRNASLSVALSQSRFVETAGSVVVLSVKYSFHKERLDDKNHQATLAEAFDMILGTKTRLRIVLEDRTKEKEAESVAPSNPLLSQAMEMLGGRIVTES